jgi:hypothetical protein
MKNNYKISIPTPCHEDWNQMTGTTTGRFCGSCAKNVVDFTAMMPTEIQQYFTANKGQNICGRFKNEQLETLVIQVPSSVLYSQKSFHKAFLMALFIAMGTSLFSCKDGNGNSQNIGEVVVVDTLNKNSETKGVLLPPEKDTIAVPPPPVLKSSKKGVLKIKFVRSTTTGAVEITEEPTPEIDTTKQPIIMGMPAVEEAPKSEK